MFKNLYIGPAGWQYKDWYGVVYPSSVKGEELSFIQQYFNFVEINSSFYRIPEPETVENWTVKISSKNFKMSIKLHKNFTHDKQFSSDDIKKFKENLLILKQKGLLASVLIQFPWSFIYTQENFSYLKKIVEIFIDFPIVVEFRHVSWLKPEIISFCKDMKITLANIDQPLLEKCLNRKDFNTGKFLYFRFHGRNSSKWFDENAKAWERYNYLYNKKELIELKREIDRVSEIQNSCYIVFNNHYRGQGVANALQLKYILTGEKVEVPSLLMRHYPELKEIGDIKAGDQLLLF